MTDRKERVERIAAGLAPWLLQPHMYDLMKAVAKKDGVKPVDIVAKTAVAIGACIVDEVDKIDEGEGEG